MEYVIFFLFAGKIALQNTLYSAVQRVTLFHFLTCAAVNTVNYK
uniref:Uncharacterized protein n=1 Tax=Anguilla anguilla TaxID=7936 RepID=A0A0E9W0K6_ANGAN